jgi:hypothetical protein
MTVSNPGGSIGVESVGTEQLKNESITFAKLGAPGGTPAKPAEKGVSAPFKSVGRRSIFSFTGDGAKTEWKFPHNMKAPPTDVLVFATAAEVPTETVTITKYVVNSQEELTVTLAAAPAAAAMMVAIIIT